MGTKNKEAYPLFGSMKSISKVPSAAHSLYHVKDIPTVYDRYFLFGVQCSYSFDQKLMLLLLLLLVAGVSASSANAVLVSQCGLFEVVSSFFL